MAQDVGAGQAATRQAVALHIGRVQGQGGAVNLAGIGQHQRSQVVLVAQQLLHRVGQMAPTFEAVQRLVPQPQPRRPHQHQLAHQGRIGRCQQRRRHPTQRKAHDLQHLPRQPMLQTGSQQGQHIVGILLMGQRVRGTKARQIQRPHGMPGLRQRPQHAQPMRPTAAAAVQHNHRGLVQMTGCRCGRPVVGGKHPARMGKSYALPLGLPLRHFWRGHLARRHRSVILRRAIPGQNCPILHLYHCATASTARA